MATTVVDGVEVGYALDGSGDPLLLIHGTTSNRTSWDALVPALSASHTLVRSELPGSGETPLTEGPLEAEALARQAIGVMAALGHERYHVAGWSLGAVIAAAVAALAPDHVRSLTLVNGWATTDARMRFTFDLWRRLIAADPEFFARYAIADGFTLASFEAFGDGIEAMVPLMTSTVAAGSDAQLELDTRVDIASLLGDITAPTLVVGGVDDRWVDIAHSRLLAEQIDNATLVELDCGHLVPQERSERLTELILGHAAAAPA
jgi:pimeloyl-ACP methyl ester carboxylesterase